MPHQELSHYLRTRTKYSARASMEQLEIAKRGATGLPKGDDYLGSNCSCRYSMTELGGKPSAHGISKHHLEPEKVANGTSVSAND